MKLGFRARVNIALGLGMAILLALGLAGIFTIDAFLGDSKRERRSQEAMLLLESTATHLKTAESWQRKYLITQDAGDLRAYQDAAVRVRSALARTRKMDALQDDLAALDALAAAIEQRLVNMEKVVRARQQSGLEAASALVGSSANSSLRERIDGLIEQIRASEVTAVQASRAETEAGARDMQRMLAAGGLFAIVLVGWSMYLTNRFASARRAAEARLAESIQQVQRVSDQLRASEAQLRDVIDTVPLTFGYIERDWRVRFHNRAYEEAFGLRFDQIRGRPLREILGPTVFDTAKPYIEEAFTGMTVTYERTQRSSDGQARDFEMKYFPRISENGEVVGVYAMGRDITEVRRIERMKSEFVSTVSHELRTPLTSIRGSLKLVAAGVTGPVPEKAKPLLDIALDNCERLVRLVNDILDLDKLGTGQLRLEAVSMPLEPLLRTATSEMQGYATQHEVGIALEVDDRTLQAEVDPGRFVQVIANLVSNAVRFSPRGGTVTVKLARDDGTARIEVQDQGPGIPEEFRNRIFQRFSQADASSTRQKSGSGLGLSISKALVERMKGSIGFRSEPGDTTFFVLLPLEPASA